MTALDRAPRSVPPDVVQGPALSSILALTSTELLQHFPDMFPSLHSSQLLHLPPSSHLPPAHPAQRSSPSSLHSRVEAKALAWIQQPHPSTHREKERWLGLHLLLALLPSASASHLRSSHPVYLKALHSLTSSTPSPTVRLLSLECHLLLLRRISSATPDLRGAALKESLCPLLADTLALTQAAEAGEGGDSGGRLHRLVRLLRDLVGDFAGSLKADDRAVIRHLLLRLLLHPDEVLVPAVVEALTSLHLSLSSASATQRQRQQAQQRLQRDAHDTAEEAEERKRHSTSDAPLPPYPHLCTQALHSLRDALTPVRAALDLPPLASTALRFDAWQPLPPALLPFDAALRYRRLTALLLALMAPVGVGGAGGGGQVSFPLQLLLESVFATLAMDAAGARDASSAALALPSLYRCALSLLRAALASMGGALLGQAEAVVALLLDVHRRCGEARSLQPLLPAVYDVVAVTLRLPLSPSLLGSAARALLPPLLAHALQPFERRQQLRAQSSVQRLSAQLQEPPQRKSTAPHPLLSEAAALPFDQSLSDLIAAAALAALEPLTSSLAFVAVEERQPLKSRVDATLLTLALSLSASSEAVPAPLRCAVYRCLVQAVVTGGQAGVNGAGSALLPYALRVFDQGAETEGLEEVRALCQQARLQCDGLRAEREGLVSGKRRRVTESAAAAKEDEDGTHLLDHYERFHAAPPPAVFAAADVGVPSLASPQGRPPARGWGAAIGSAVEVGEKRRRTDDEAPLNGAAHGQRDAGETDGDDLSDAGEEAADDSAEAGEVEERMEAAVDRQEVVAERAFQPRSETTSARGSDGGPGAVVEEVDEDEDVPALNVDDEPDESDT